MSVDADEREKLTRQVAVQLQVALTAWHELYPDDTDADACDASMKIVEEDVDGILSNREEAPTVVETPAVETRGTAAQNPKDRFGLASGTFRDHIIEVAIAHPEGFDIATIIEEAQAKGWRHVDPRPYATLQVTQLARMGLLTRIGRGVYVPAGSGDAPRNF